MTPQAIILAAQAAGEHIARAKQCAQEGWWKESQGHMNRAMDAVADLIEAAAAELYEQRALAFPACEIAMKQMPHESSWV